MKIIINLKNMEKVMLLKLKKKENKLKKMK